MEQDDTPPRTLLCATEDSGRGWGKVGPIPSLRQTLLCCASFCAAIEAPSFSPESLSPLAKDDADSYRGSFLLVCG